MLEIFRIPKDYEHWRSGGINKNNRLYDVLMNFRISNFIHEFWGESAGIKISNLHHGAFNPERLEISSLKYPAVQLWDFKSL